MLADKWFCSDICEKRQSEALSRPDRVLQYTMALTADGLYHLARDDAVKEGDGEAMMQHWAIDLVQLWNNGHYKYTILAHQMLYGMS